MALPVCPDQVPLTAAAAQCATAGTPVYSPGLEYLTQIDQLIVNAQVDLMEVLVDFKFDKIYQLKNSLGQLAFYALEDTDCCTRNLCGSLRPFLIKVVDNYHCEIMRFIRPLKCDSCCFPCCLQEMEVQVPPGNPAGYVCQEWHPYLPKFTIHNERKEPVLKIRGPFCTCRCFSDVPFEVTSLDEKTVIGKISKQWSGMAREFFSDADNFGIQFPMDMDVKMKAVLIGACFLIDFIYFEH